jgi:tRNA (mo5U34)-methyltransferase
VSADLARRAAELGWYHTLALPGGVVTDGFFDTLAALPSSGMPERLDGKRCLDVGTCDGFWAFEMERRGAAEVVGIDLDDPVLRDWPDLGISEAVRGAGADRSKRTFALAAEAIGSKVERRLVSIYDVSPELLGTFDFVFIGSLLLHLRDPVGALMAVRSVCEGELLSMDAVSPSLTRAMPTRPVASLSRRPEPRWWTCNRIGLATMVERAGFEPQSVSKMYYLPFGKGHPGIKAADWRSNPRGTAWWFAGGRKGAAVVSVHARPR